MRHRTAAERQTLPSLRRRHYRAAVNGVNLHWVEAGPADGPPVVLLHGFPEFWYSWRLQLPALAAAGFRTIAPDLRGYNTSAKPKRVLDYRMAALVADVAGLIDHAAGGRAGLVGHDWGGGVAWVVAMTHPGRVEKLAILNAPHPAAYLREMRTAAQLLRSWYVFFFQLPWLPEAVLRWDDYALARRAFRHGPARHSAHPDRDVGRYVRALARPGVLTAAVNYYRAALRRPSAVKALVRPTDVPTLLIWGDRDPYLVPTSTEGLELWVRHLRVEHLPHATHWVQHDEPKRVNHLLTEFFRQGVQVL